MALFSKWLEIKAIKMKIFAIDPYLGDTFGGSIAHHMLPSCDQSDPQYNAKKYSRN